MEKRHQVFVSSTYTDLLAERAAIIEALLELDCFPAGMELFPATSIGAWDLIRGVIDDSDYYCLVIGGRYGTTDVDGVSYTEKEYDYAVASKKPLLAFLHKDPGTITAKASEKSDQGRQRLESFRAKVEATHHCKYWRSADELAGQVSRSIILLRKAHPAEGWVRGRYAADETVVLENAALRARAAQLAAELELAKASTEVPPDVARGADLVDLTVSFLVSPGKDYLTERVKPSWDQILGYVGPSLIAECSEQDFLDCLTLCFFHLITDNPAWKDVEYSSIVVPRVVIDIVKTQLRALKYIELGTKRRAVSDSQVYWKLTREGETRLIRVQAAKRPKAAGDRDEGSAPAASTLPVALS